MNAETAKRKPTYHVAFDCGNSSFRIMLGTYEDGVMSVEVIDQIPNEAIESGGLLSWDIEAIFAGLKRGLRVAYERHGRIDTVGLATWGIDFGLLDESGALIANPLCYRNTLGVAALGRLSPEARSFTWEHSGIQNHPMNSLYQLLGIRDRLPDKLLRARRLLFIPDLILYLFTGEMATERSIASTSQLYDTRAGAYSRDILNYYGLSEALLPPLKRHGEVVGWLKKELQTELGIGPCPFICTPSHDTASAVAALPTLERNQVFISSGTWSLIGIEQPRPLVSAEVERCKFANEAGVFDTTTLLKNSTGLYLLQEMKKHFKATDTPLGWEEIAKVAMERGVDVPVFDPNHPEIFGTRDMFGTLSRLVGSCDYRTLLASSYLSLALCYRRTMGEIDSLTGERHSHVYVIGGGCRDRYLCQLTADVTGMVVHTGPMEAASLGNLVVQRRHLDPGLDLARLRTIVMDSTGGERETFTPRTAGGETLSRKMKEYEALVCP
jgi:sugar (pentulose or hexulose) kinase